MSQDEPSLKRIRSYVLRSGRVTRAQRRAWETLKEFYILPFQEHALDLKTHFPQCKEYVLEIGFGTGEALATLARRWPEKGFLGVEVYISGVGNLMKMIEAERLTNVRVICHDAIDVIEKMIPQGSLSGVHIFFPDPWPKKRHVKRRLIQAPFLQHVIATLAPQGYLYLVTDWEDYAWHIKTLLEHTTTLRNRYSGWAPSQEWRPCTRFEEKAKKEGRSVNELLFEKRSLFTS